MAKTLAVGFAGASLDAVAFSDGFEQSGEMLGTSPVSRNAARRTTVPLHLTYLPAGEQGTLGGGAFVADLSGNRTYKLMRNNPSALWYGPEGLTYYRNNSGYAVFGSAEAGSGYTTSSSFQVCVTFVISYAARTLPLTTVLLSLQPPALRPTRRPVREQ